MELISVILPVYNAERYIKESVDSILKQTYSNLELIIIDDCSIDGTAQILDSYTDPRIVRITNDRNRGIVYSLNCGLSAARGVYIARMDADDISLPNRFERQLEYMKNHPEVIISSCWFETFGAHNNVVKFQEKHDNIYPEFLFGNHFLHPGYFMDAVKMRKHNLSYDENMKLVEDYDMAIRAGSIGMLANVPEVLLKYRVHDKQTSSISSLRQHELGAILRKKLLLGLGIDLDSTQCAIFEDICVWEKYDICDNHTAKIALDIYRSMLSQNKIARIYNDRCFAELIYNRMYIMLRIAFLKGKIDTNTYICLSLFYFTGRLRAKLLLAMILKRNKHE